MSIRWSWLVCAVASCSSPAATPVHSAPPSPPAQPASPPPPPPPVFACPAAAPTTGDTCNGAGGCTYDSCATTGTTLARCVGGRWSVATRPCERTTCPSDSSGFPPCAPGQLCVVVQSGARMASCVKNACAPGQLISCACVGQAPSSSCSAIGHQIDIGVGCHGCP
ncbi:MAG TPA: hypothetical protein VGG74_09275 [Kofleriaceae bacterium]